MQQFCYFLAVAQELNISRAAKKLFISQQALSESIMRLEQKYMVPLFVRSDRGHITSLTGFSQKLVVIAANIVEQENGFIRECNKLNEGLKGKIRIGITSTMTRLLLPWVLPVFKGFFPNVELITNTDVYDELKKAMNEGRLDILLGFGHERSLSNFHSTQLATEQIYIILCEQLLKKYYNNPSEKSLISFVSGVDMASFSGIPCLLPPAGHYTHKVMHKIFVKHKIDPNTVLEANSGDILIQMASRGIGAAFCLKPVLIGSLALFDQISEHKLCAFPLTEDEAQVDIALYYPRKLSMDESILTFGKIFKKSYRDLLRTADEKIKTHETKIIFDTTV